MFEKCLKCNRLGKDCFPNVFVMDVAGIRLWARKLKVARGITNAELARKSGVPKGTIDNHFSAKATHSADVNYSTFAPVLCALLDCGKEEMECPGSSEKDSHTDRDIEFLKEQLRISQEIAHERKKLLILSCFALFITLSIIILALVVDKINPDIGFFWRTMFDPVTENNKEGIMHQISEWRM